MPRGEIKAPVVGMSRGETKAPNVEVGMGMSVVVAPGVNVGGTDDLPPLASAMTSPTITPVTPIPATHFQEEAVGAGIEVEAGAGGGSMVANLCPQ
jgi:hypothetical protein